MKQETMEKGAEKWVFETNAHKWSNNDDTAGDNFGSFIAGAKWQQEQAKEMEKEQRQEDTNYGYSQGWDDGNQNKEPMRPELKQQEQ